MKKQKQSIIYRKWIIRIRRMYPIGLYVIIAELLTGCHIKKIFNIISVDEGLELAKNYIDEIFPGEMPETEGE